MTDRRASVVELAGNDTAQSCLTPRETAGFSQSLDDLREIVRDLSRRVARCEIEIAGRAGNVATVLLLQPEDAE
jgi:hypothetical protein